MQEKSPFQINQNDLNSDDKLTYKLLKEHVETFVNGWKWRHYGLFNQVNFLENIPVDFSSFIVDSTRFTSVSDFEMYIKRLEVHCLLLWYS